MSKNKHLSCAAQQSVTVVRLKIFVPHVLQAVNVCLMKTVLFRDLQRVVYKHPSFPVFTYAYQTRASEFKVGCFHLIDISVRVKPAVYRVQQGAHLVHLFFCVRAAAEWELARQKNFVSYKGEEIMV